MTQEKIVFVPYPIDKEEFDDMACQSLNRDGGFWYKRRNEIRYMDADWVRGINKMLEEEKPK